MFRLHANVLGVISEDAKSQHQHVHDQLSATGNGSPVANNGVRVLGFTPSSGLQWSFCSFTRTSIPACAHDITLTSCHAHRHFRLQVRPVEEEVTESGLLGELTEREREREGKASLYNLWLMAESRVPTTSRILATPHTASPSGPAGPRHCQSPTRLAEP